MCTSSLALVLSIVILIPLQWIPLARSELASAVYSLPVLPCREISPVSQEGYSVQLAVMPVEGTCELVSV